MSLTSDSLALGFVVLILIAAYYLGGATLFYNIASAWKPTAEKQHLPKGWLYVDGKYVNMNNVTFVEPLDEITCVIVFGNDVTVPVTTSAEDVMESYSKYWGEQ